MKKFFLILVSIGALIGIGALVRGGGNTAPTGNAQNVSTIDGTQVIQIAAKGGYWPRMTTAQANTPTVVNVQTRGTYDCSAALVMPDIGYETFLPPNGETKIQLPPQPSGTIVRGLCSMGMYNFDIRFE